MNGTAMIRGPSTVEESSLSLAEGWVRENLQRETHEQGLKAGDEIEVAGLDQCDCVPLDVSFDCGSRVGNWRLSSVRERGIRKVSATYKWEPKR